MKNSLNSNYWVDSSHSFNKESEFLDKIELQKPIELSKGGTVIVCVLATKNSVNLATKW